MLSKFYKKIELGNGDYAIFNSLIREVYIASEEKIYDIEHGNLKKSDTRKLTKARIYISDNKEDDALLEKVRQSFLDENTDITMAYVIPSLGCNLKCDYCYIINNCENNYDNGNMSIKILDTFLEKYVYYLKQNKIKNAMILFYGGEPCCNWEIVKQCVEKGRQMYPFDFVMITNGTLLDEEKIAFIKKNKIGVGISIDGVKEITDCHRKYRIGNNSVFETVFEKIKRLKNEGIRLALSVTITDEFLDKQNEILDMFEELGVNNVNYNLLHSHLKQEKFEEYYERATKFLIKSYERLAPKGIFDDRLLRKIESFAQDIFYFADCSATYANQIVIKPNGNVGICQGECASGENEIGNILDDNFERLLSHKKRLEWRERIPLFNEKCIYCDAISLCGGGCALQAKELYEDENGVDSAFCVHSKYIIFWILQKYYRNKVRKGDLL